MAKTAEEKLARARSWLLGRKWKVLKHRLVASVGYESLTVTLNQQEEAIARDLLEPAVAAIYADEKDVLNTALKIVEGADYGGTWILREAGIDRNPIGGNPPQDNELYLYKTYVRKTALNALAHVMENNCSFVVTNTFYFGVTALPAVTQGSSGITYRLMSANFDREDGLWNAIMEKREQLVTTTGVVTVADDIFKTVTEQTFYGVRTDDKDENGAAVALWTPGNPSAGTLIETTSVSKNENCTRDIRQRKTVAKEKQATVERYQTVFETGVTITVRNQAAAVNAFVAVANGMITRRSSKQNDDGTFDNTETVTTAVEADNAVVETYETAFETGVTITNRNEAAAVSTSVSVANGIITRRSAKLNADGTFDNTEAKTTAVAAANAVVERYQTVFETGVTITNRNQAAAVNAFVAVAGGVITRRSSKQNDDGTFDNTEALTTAVEADNALVETYETAFETGVTITNRNEAAAVSTSVSVANGIITRRSAKLNDNGTFDNTEVKTTAVAAANAVIERYQTVFETGVTITNRNQTTAVNALVTVADGVITRRSSRLLESGRFDNTETLTTAVEANNAVVETYETAFETGVTITNRNAAAAVSASVAVANGIITRRSAKLNDNGTFDNTESLTTAVAAANAVIERYQTVFETGVTITNRNQTTAVNALVTVADGVITRRSSRLLESGRFDNTETLTTAVEADNAVVETYETAFETGVTITNRNEAAAVSASVVVANGIITRRSSKLNDNGTFDNTEAKTTAVAAANAVIERYQTVFETGVTITNRNQTTAVNALVTVADGVITRRSSRLLESGRFDNTETLTTAVQADNAVVETYETAFETGVTITNRNEAAAVSTSVAVAAGIITRRSSKLNDNGTFDNTESLTTAIADVEERTETLRDNMRVLTRTVTRGKATKETEPTADTEGVVKQVANKLLENGRYEATAIDDTAIPRQLTLNVVDDDGPYVVYKIENYTVANANTFLAGLNTAGVKNSVQMEISRYPGCVSMTVVSRNTGDTGALEYLVKYNKTALTEKLVRIVGGAGGKVYKDVYTVTYTMKRGTGLATAAEEYGDGNAYAEWGGYFRDLGRNWYAYKKVTGVARTSRMDITTTFNGTGSVTL